MLIRITQGAQKCKSQVSGRTGAKQCPLDMTGPLCSQQLWPPAEDLHKNKVSWCASVEVEGVRVSQCASTEKERGPGQSECEHGS